MFFVIARLTKLAEAISNLTDEIVCHPVSLWPDIGGLRSLRYLAMT